MNLPKATCLGAALLLVAITARGARPLPVCSPGSPPQSPRNVDPKPPSPYNGTSSTSIVTSVSPQADSIVYKSRPDGPEVTLWRCDQHYHVPSENPQGCPGDTAAGGGGGYKGAGGLPPLAQWIEVHTVYAAVVSDKSCLDKDLSCCLVGPYVVRGFSAKVTSGGEAGPIIPPTGRPLAEWSGSNTGPDKPPGTCKQVAAQWSFRLGCDFTVGQNQLKVFDRPHGARPVQSGELVSKDLTLVN